MMTPWRLNATISAAITNSWPVHFPAGTYKVTSQIMIDYAGQASKGFRLISEGAVIDGRTIASGPVLQIECGGGTIASPTGCFYFKEEGTPIRQRQYSGLCGGARENRFFRCA